MASLERILEELSRADAYPHAADDLEVVQTHMSVVFLAGDRAYKIKKPVRFRFADFRDPEHRRRVCHDEVRLNRRLAPSVYEGVVPVVDVPDGLRFREATVEDGRAAPSGEADGEVVEWAVRMVRLPPDRTLKTLVRSGELDGGRGPQLLARLAHLLARFHRDADRGEEISAHADFGSVARNASENFDELEERVGTTVSGPVLRRLRELSDAALRQHRGLIERRAREHRACDTHGDLRLGHVYHLPDPEPDGRFEIIDCIEFDDRFRYADPISDLAFLVMELELEDRPGLARTLAGAYLSAAGDPEGEALLPYYVAYRHVVRGKVDTLTAEDPAVPEAERLHCAARATRHLLRALRRLAPPGEGPALVLVGGLPGVGKSVLARGLAQEAGFTWIDTDRVREELTGAAGVARGSEAFEEGAYSPEWTARTYAECLRRATALLFDGGRVVVEASFRRDEHRRAFLGAARELGVPALLLVCEADRETVRERLEGRPPPSAGEAGGSDADWRIHREMEGRWEAPGPDTAPFVRAVRTEGPPGEVLERAVARVREATGPTPALSPPPRRRGPPRRRDRGAGR